jgi:hypothetical protein
VPLKQNVSGGEAEVSLGGICIEVRFDAAGVKTIDLPAALQSIPVHVEPMSVPELTPPGTGKKSSTLRVSAVNRSAWTHKQIQLQADDDAMDTTPFPCVQKFRVYPGPVSAQVLAPSAGLGGAATFREQIDNIVNNVSTTPKSGGIPKAGTDGKLDPLWLSLLGPNVLSQEDDFAGGIEDRAATVGVEGWSGSTTERPAEASHPGIVRLTANNSLAVLRAGRAYSTDVVLYAAYVRPASGTATMGLRVGLLAHPSMSDEDSAGIYFSFSPGTSANWRCITRTGGSTTATTTDVAYAVGTWYWLEVVKSDSSYLFYIDGVLKATHTTDIPAFSVTRALVVEAAEAADKSVDIDYSDLKTAETGRGV